MSRTLTRIVLVLGICLLPVFFVVKICIFDQRTEDVSVIQKPISVKGCLNKSTLLLNSNSFSHNEEEQINKSIDENIQFELNDISAAKIFRLIENGIKQRQQIKLIADGIMLITFDDGTSLEYEILFEPSIVRGTSSNKKDFGNDIKVNQEIFRDLVFDMIQSSDNFSTDEKAEQP